MSMIQKETIDVEGSSCYCERIVRHGVIRWAGMDATLQVEDPLLQERPFWHPLIIILL